MSTIAEFVRIVAAAALRIGLQGVALTLYRRAAAWCPDDPYFLFEYTAACIDTGRWEEAESGLRRLVRLNYSPPRNHYLLAMVLQTLGRDEEAITQFQHVMAMEPSPATLHYNLGVSFFALKRWDEAIDAFVEAIRMEPHAADASAYLGLAFVEAGQPEHATVWLQKAVRLGRSRDDYINLGVNLHELERLDEAEAAFRKALALDTKSRDVRLRLAAVLMDRRKFEEALDILDGAKRAHRDPMVQSLKSVVLVQLERFDAARGAALGAIELGPTIGETHFSLGYFHLVAGEVSVALDEFDRAVQIDPKRPDFLAGKAAALTKSGRHAEAVAMFGGVLAVNAEYLKREPEMLAYYEQSKAAAGQHSND